MICLRTYFILALFFASLVCHAETETTAPSAETRSPEMVYGLRSKITDTGATPQVPLRKQLIERLKVRGGAPANIVVFSVMDSVPTGFATEVAAAVETALKSYGLPRVRRETYRLPAMTMEEIRLAMVRFNVDILVAPLVENGYVDLYFFDRRLPYHLYAHSEALPPGGVGSQPAELARQMVRLLMRRVLYHYLTDQYYELPREESPPVLQAEIPVWIANRESLEMVNRELVSRFYLNVSLGAAISMAKSKQLWNSNLIGTQLGIRLWDRFYLEGQVSSFSYNAFAGSLRYTFLNRNTPFRLNVGLGFAFVTRDKVWNLDQTIGLGRYSYYFVPSASVLFPIGEVYLKMEAQAFVAPRFNQFIWTFMPGIQVHF